jgi:hypothetical protein
MSRHWIGPFQTYDPPTLDDMYACRLGTHIFECDAKSLFDTCPGKKVDNEMEPNKTIKCQTCKGQSLRFLQVLDQNTYNK